MITGYNEGANISILNTVYRKAYFDENDKFQKDKMIILYKDLDTGEKRYEIIKEPDYEYYVLKPTSKQEHPLLFDVRDDDIITDSYSPFFESYDRLEKHTCKYRKLLEDIAIVTNNYDAYMYNKQIGDYKANKKLHELHAILNSDMNIEDHYRFRFNNLYKNESITNIKKAYFDIEADIDKINGEFPQPGECPINAISYIDDSQNMIYIFLLRDPTNPLIQQFEESVGQDLYDELRLFICNAVGGPKKNRKFGLDKFNYRFFFYDEEIQLINDFFILVNMNEPDFMLAWNMAFDIPFIIERLKRLGYNPADIMCHPSYKNEDKIAEYYIDEKHKNEFAERGDFYTIMTNTIYLDQMIQFASIRKGQAAFPNFKLNTAGEIICDVKKLDYSHITTQLAKLPLLDYKTFIFYNIVDTIVQKCIEMTVSDIDYVYNKSHINNVRYSKAHRQTVYLGNRGTKHFAECGFVMGNNRNKNEPKVDFLGAKVGDPKNNGDRSKLHQNGEIYNIADNLNDYDYKSLYPSIGRENNMAPNTQYGKIIIENQVFEQENPFNMELYDRGAAYAEDLITHNWISFCHRWFSLANYREFLEDFMEYAIVHFRKAPRRFDDQGRIIPFVRITDQNKNSKVQWYTKEPRKKPFIKIPDRINYNDYLKEIL